MECNSKRGSEDRAYLVLPCVIGVVKCRPSNRPQPLATVDTLPTVAFAISKTYTREGNEGGLPLHPRDIKTAAGSD